MLKLGFFLLSAANAVQILALQDQFLSATLR